MFFFRELTTCIINGLKETYLQHLNVLFVIKLVDLLLGNFLQLINREYNFYIIIIYTIFYSKVCLTHVIIRLQDWRCLWCRACVHATCRANFIQNCSFGETRTATVPPTCLIKHKGIFLFILPYHRFLYRSIYDTLTYV